MLKIFKMLFGQVKKWCSTHGFSVGSRCTCGGCSGHVQDVSYLKDIRDVRAYFILTNAYHPEIAKIFEGKGEMLTYDRTCNIGGKAARRGKVQEYIFTNIPGVKREEAEE